MDVRDRNSCIRFAKELLTSPFFGGYPPLAEFETTFIERVAGQLQKDLAPTLPKDVSNATWSPHPRIRIRVQHRDGELVDAQFVRDRSKILSDADNRIANDVFDIQSIVDHPLGELAGRHGRSAPLVDLIISAMDHQLSGSARAVVVQGKRDAYAAILTEVRKRPFQRATVFDVHLVPIPPSSPAASSPARKVTRPLPLKKRSRQVARAPALGRAQTAILAAGAG